MLWVLGPYQKEPWQGPYFPVLNAWTLLLGCTLNFESDPNPEFFHETHQLIGLTIASRADWRLIYAFLRCKQYIKGDQLPERGRWFSSKQSLLGDAPSSSEGSPDIVDEEMPQLSLYDFDARPISGRKRPHDRVFHTEAYAGWDEKDISTRAHAVGRAGHKICQLDSAKPRSVYRKLMAEARHSKKDLRESDKPCASLKAQLEDLKNDEEIAERL